VHARTSSENWAGSFFFLGLALLESQTFWSTSGSRAVALGAGLVWGVAFQCRYQIAFALFGAVAWYAWRGYLGPCFILRWFPVVGGFALATAVGAVADRWGYGEWTLTPWHYFAVNILQSKASEWGVSPWWDYFWLVAVRGGPPISLVVLGG